MTYFFIKIVLNAKMSKILKERDEFNQLSNSAIEYWFARDLQKNACENSSIEVIELMRNDKLKNLRGRFV